jgi:hypothetical protein
MSLQKDAARVKVTARAVSYLEGLDPGSASRSASSSRSSDWAHPPEERTPLLYLPHPASASNIAPSTMEKVKNSKLAYWADKLAVESEPGLTNAQVNSTLSCRAMR